MEAVLVALVASLGTTGIGGLVARFVSVGRAHRLRRGIDQLDQLLERPHLGEQERAALTLAREAQSVRLAVTHLFPASREWRDLLIPLVVTLVVSYVIQLGLALITGFSPGETKLSPSASFTVLLICAVLVIGAVLFLTGAADARREVFVNHVMRGREASWAFVEKTLTLSPADSMLDQRSRRKSGKLPFALEPTSREYNEETARRVRVLLTGVLKRRARGQHVPPEADEPTDS